MTLSSIPEIIKDVQAGKFIILVDDEGRENEGDLIMAAEKISAEAINFMAKNARGLICMPITEQRLNELNIPMMVGENTAMHGTAFTVSVDAKIRGVTTGISAHDRAETIKAIIAPATRAVAIPDRCCGSVYIGELTACSLSSLSIDGAGRSFGYV